MQIKSSRGVQQEDVWAAADLLIAEGLRPTIERVRQKIGRGSPNTVSPMLETWFATLAPRLGMGSTKKAGISRLPDSVQQAMLKLWDNALLLAQEAAVADLANAQQALDKQQFDVKNRQIDLGNREQILVQREIAIDDALKIARIQIADQTLRVEQTQNLLSKREHEVMTLRSDLMALINARDADQRQSTEDATRRADERRRHEARSTANEHRLLMEIDRERQEVKSVKTELVDKVRHTDSVRKQLEITNKSLHDKAQVLEVEIKSLRQDLDSASERSSELHNLLAEQSATSTAALNKIKLLMNESARKSKTLASRRKRV